MIEPPPDGNAEIESEEKTGLSKPAVVQWTLEQIVFPAVIALLLSVVGRTPLWGSMIYFVACDLARRGMVKLIVWGREEMDEHPVLCEVMAIACVALPMVYALMFAFDTLGLREWSMQSAEGFFQFFVYVPYAAASRALRPRLKAWLQARFR